MWDEAGREPLGWLFVRVTKLHRARVHDALEQLGLYRGQSAILAVLWDEEGLPQSELAARTWVRPATMTTALQRMEVSNLVVRRPDADDQRISRVYLTEAGRALEIPVREAFRDVEQETFAELSYDEQDTLRRFLEQIASNLSEEE